jgi:hypothetical protein
MSDYEYEEKDGWSDPEEAGGWSDPENPDEGSDVKVQIDNGMYLAEDLINKNKAESLKKFEEVL